MTLKHLGLALCLVIASVLPAHAEAEAAKTKAKFAATDAADCAAVFGWVLRYLAPSGLPEKQVTQTNIAFMMWGYELNAAMPGADEAAMKKVAGDAVARLDRTLPPADTAEQAEKVIDFVIDKADTCGRRISDAYDGKPHPVVTEIDRQTAAARKADQKARSLRD